MTEEEARALKPGDRVLKLTTVYHDLPHDTPGKVWLATKGTAELVPYDYILPAPPEPFKVGDVVWNGGGALLKIEAIRHGQCWAFDSDGEGCTYWPRELYRTREEAEAEQ